MILANVVGPMIKSKILWTGLLKAATLEPSLHVIMDRNTVRIIFVWTPYVYVLLFLMKPIF